MAGRGRPGAAPQTAKREQYAVLVARGVSNAEACRIVGVNRRTGKYWRHGRTVTSSNGRDTNGLLRQYFPKGTNLHSHDGEQLAAVAEELNTRPRKTLGWRTPAARLADVTARPARVSGRRRVRGGRVPGSAYAGRA